MTLTQELVLSGMGGGVAAEGLRWYKLRASTELPEYVRSIRYWAWTVAMILAGGGIAFFYMTNQGLESPLAAIQLGAGAPTIIGAMAQGSSGEAQESAEMTARGGLDEDYEPPPPKKPGLREFLGFRG